MQKPLFIHDDRVVDIYTAVHRGRRNGISLAVTWNNQQLVWYPLELFGQADETPVEPRLLFEFIKYRTMLEPSMSEYPVQSSRYRLKMFLHRGQRRLAERQAGLEVL